MADIPAFEIAEVSGAAPVCIVCVGELDVATVPVLREVMDANDDDIVLDCERLAFLDSAGAGLLAGQQARLQAHGHRLRLVNLEGPPRRSLEIVGLADLIA